MYIYKMNRNIMNNIFYKHIESLLDRNDLEINLFSGKTGLLLLYSTYKYKNESLIQNTLDEITQKIFTIKEFNFHTGISGIGYGLHLLKRNRKISHELQTIFQYIDDKIYHEVSNKKSSSLCLSSEKSVLTKAFYFQQSIKSYYETNRYRKLANKECLLLALNEIRDLISIIIQNRDTIINNRPKFLYETGQCFVLLYRVLSQQCSIGYCQEVLLLIRDFIRSFFNYKSNISEENILYSFRLLYSYAYVAFDIKDISMQQEIKKWIIELRQFITPTKLSNRDIHRLNQIFKSCSIEYKIDYNQIDLKTESFYIKEAVDYLLFLNIHHETIPFEIIL